jgi:hypothetical protein
MGGKGEARVRGGLSQSVMMLSKRKEIMILMEMGFQGGGSVRF